MNKNEFSIPIWLELVEKINKLAPEFGKINLELLWHQGRLSKAVIIYKSETIIFEKEEKNEKK